MRESKDVGLRDRPPEEGGHGGFGGGGKEEEEEACSRARRRDILRRGGFGSRCRGNDGDDGDDVHDAAGADRRRPVVGDPRRRRAARQHGEDRRPVHAGAPEADAARRSPRRRRVHEPHLRQEEGDAAVRQGAAGAAWLRRDG